MHVPLADMTTLVTVVVGLRLADDDAGSAYPNVDQTDAGLAIRHASPILEPALSPTDIEAVRAALQQPPPAPSLGQDAPLRARPEPIPITGLDRLDIRRCDCLGGALHEYRHAA